MPEGFDFGQFKEMFDYLSEKLASGGALTPEEQKVYDLLLGFAGQGLNLTGTADFNSLYTAFQALADDATKKEFARLYGDNLFQDANGQIQFTRPGSVIEQFMRRGLSVNDGPVMAALSEGLKEYMNVIAKNSFGAMTNAYSAMTPIRDQNLRAMLGAGGIAGTAAGRRVPIVGPATSASMPGPGAGGVGEGGGEPISIDTRGAGGGGNDRGFLEGPLGQALLGILGTGALGIGGFLLKDWWKDRNAPQHFSDTDLDRAAEEIVGRNPFSPTPNVEQQYEGFGTEPTMYYPQAQVDPYGGLNPNIWNSTQTPQFDANQYLGAYGPPQDSYFGSPTQNMGSWQTNPNNFYASDWGQTGNWDQPVAYDNYSWWQDQPSQYPADYWDYGSGSSGDWSNYDYGYSSPDTGGYWW